jgi:hypothetical protein
MSSYPRDDAALDDIKARLADPSVVVKVLDLGKGAQRQAGGFLVRCPASARLVRFTMNTKTTTARSPNLAVRTSELKNT